MPITPTIDSLSFFVVYTSAHISPRSVSTYLSGVVHCLEPYYPHIRQLRDSQFIRACLAGCHKSRDKPTSRKPPFLHSHLRRLITSLSQSPVYEDQLFLAIAVHASFGVHRLGELTSSDVVALRSIRKVIKRHTHVSSSIGHSYVLPYHKADRYFLGNTVIIPSRDDDLDPTPLISNFLRLRDARFPNRCELFLTAAGQVPTRSWFLSRLTRAFPTEGFGGHSLRAGAATELALANTPEHLIKRLGRWSSDAWERYIRVHPMILATILQQRAAVLPPIPRSTLDVPPQPLLLPQNTSLVPVSAAANV